MMRGFMTTLAVICVTTRVLALGQARITQLSPLMRPSLLPPQAPSLGAPHRLLDLLLLPRPLALAIFALLPVDTRLRCCEVSRAWRALLADTTFFERSDLHASSDLARFSLPLLRAAVAKAGGQLRVLDISVQGSSSYRYGGVAGAQRVNVHLEGPLHCYARQRRARWRPASAGQARFGAARERPAFGNRGSQPAAGAPCRCRTVCDSHSASAAAQRAVW